MTPHDILHEALVNILSIALDSESKDRAMGQIVYIASRAIFDHRKASDVSDMFEAHARAALERAGNVSGKP